MQINAIGISPEFTAKNKHSRANIDDFINLDDRQVRQLASIETMQSIDNKKHKKVSNALFYSVPLVAGLAAAALTKGNATFLNKNVSGLAAKAANGLKSVGYWGGLLAAVDLVCAGRKKLNQKFENVRNLDKQHPFVSFLATLGSGVVAISLGNKGLNYLLKKVKPTTVAKVQSKVGKVALKINKNETLRSISKSVSNTVDKIHPSIKGFVKSILPWAPDAMLIGGIVNSVNYNSKINREYARNYNDIKERQFELSQARINELKNY